jgi:hypothetical protein
VIRRGININRGIIIQYSNPMGNKQLEIESIPGPGKKLVGRTGFTKDKLPVSARS